MSDSPRDRPSKGKASASERPAAAPDAVYRRRLAGFEAEAAERERRSRALAGARLATMTAAVVLLAIVVVQASAPPAWAIAGAVLALIAFAALAKVHGAVLDGLGRARELAAIQRAALARRARDWDAAPLPAAPAIEAGAVEEQEGDAVLAHDLDLFGHASLFQLLGTAWTPPGRTTLAGWLLRPAEPEEIAARQEAVTELAPRIGFRHELERAARRLDEAHPDPSRFVAWAEAAPWLLRRPGWIWASRLLPPLALAAIGAAIAGIVPLGLAALPLLVNLVLSWVLRDRLDAAFSAVDAGAPDVQAYAETLRLAAEESYRGRRLERLGQALRPAGTPAWRWMRQLARRLEIADARHGSFHVIPQVLTLWDLHSLWALERWREAVGREVRGWLAALGELEALAALAGLAHDQPGWTLPEVKAADAPSDGTGSGAVLTARGLGHPLLADGSRIANDVTVGPPGTFLLVTGSNMAGKSTLLRALGVNAVLAQAGGPVCAEALRLPPLTVATSMRISDSLAGGVSRFMAEALRIRAVVEAARAAPAERPILYLLDEALAGTNARERRQAMRAVISHLLAAGAIGAVAGHDLELAATAASATAALAAAAQPVHFRETIHPHGEGGPRMTFDYRLRPGLAVTSNALELMELLGLGERLEEGSYSGS